MANWNEPTNSQPTHVNVLQRLAEKDDYAITMGQLDAGFTNIPNGAMNWDDEAKLFRRKNAAVFEPVSLSVAGGGTGANNAADARQNLGVPETGSAATQVRTNAQNEAKFVDQTVSVNTIGALSGGGSLIGDRTLTVRSATTGQSGVVQLNDTLTSDSASQALTAKQGKALNDKINSSGRTAQQRLGIYHGSWYVNSGMLPLGWSGVHDAVGRYRIIHNFGSSNYTVVVKNSDNSIQSPIVVEFIKASNYIAVSAFYFSGTTIIDSDTSFEFILMRY